MLTNLALRRPLAVLDLETTGVNAQTDRIVEISVLLIQPDRQTTHHTRRCNPGQPIPHDATAIHGITDADVEAEPPFEEIADDVLTWLADCDLCGFNLKRFDLPLLYNEFRRIGRNFDYDGRALIDAQEIFHAYEPRNLGAAVRFYLGREHQDGHTAAADVLATAAVLDAMLIRYPDLQRDVAGLHAQFKDPNALDSGGWFRRISGEVRFTKGKHRGQPLEFVARNTPDYLEWMLAADFMPDTKALVREALRRAKSRAK
jgi:DNA polymerase-3 subunit epsilon